MSSDHYKYGTGHATQPTNTWIYPYPRPYVRPSGVCPGCGRCGTCGEPGGPRVYPLRPYQPYWSVIPPTVCGTGTVSSSSGTAGP